MAERLKVLYITHYFPPEVNAPALRVSEMGARWADKGAEVTVLTGFPNHPTGVIPEQYRGMKRLVGSFDKLKVVRTYVYAAANKGFVRRVLNFLSFMVSAVALGYSKVGKPDIIIATSPQFFVGVAGYVLSRMKGSKFIFEVRDVWPEEIVAVGAIKNKFIIRMLEKLEMFLYRKADLVMAVAQGTIDILSERGVPREKLALIPNGVDIEHFQQARESGKIRKELGFGDKFVVSYIGTHGMAHRLDVVLKAAFRLQKNEKIQFLFVGDGADKKNLMNIAEQLNLKNVYFHEQIDRSRIPEFYHMTDLFLVPLRKAELFTKNIPSKIYEVMAAQKPILIATEGESRKLVENSGAGIGTTPEDVEEMAEKIMYLYRDEKLRQKMGQDGYSFALANASRIKLADEYYEIMRNMVDNGIIRDDKKITEPEAVQLLEKDKSFV